MNLIHSFFVTIIRDAGPSRIQDHIMLYGWSHQLAYVMDGKVYFIYYNFGSNVL